MILLRCPCGKKLRLRPEHAGRTGRCPACGREIRVPLCDEEPAAPPPRARPTRPSSQDAVPPLEPPTPSGSDRIDATKAEPPPSRDARTMQIPRGAGAQRAPARAPSSSPMPISREARTVPEPIRPPAGALAAWKRRGPGGGDDPALAEAAGAKTQRVDRIPTLSMQKTGQLKPASRPDDKPDDKDTLKMRLDRDEKTVDLPMNVGSDTLEATGPGGPRMVPRTDPVRAIEPLAGLGASPEAEGSQAIGPRGSEDGTRPEPEDRSPWFENPTFVMLLLGLVYPVGVAGTLLSTTWATRLQKALALLSVALLSMGAVAALLGR